MQIISGRFCLILLIVPLACSETPVPGKQVLVKNELGNKVVDSYWLYLPSNYDENRKWPIILFLQGQGVISRDPITCKNDGPVFYRDSHVSSLINEFIIINPHMTIGQIEDRQWPLYSSTLLEIVKSVSTSYNGDTTRFYLTGLSLGGSGTWEMGKSNPDFFAAIVPISGALYCDSDCDKLKNQNVWIIHNQNDNTISHTYPVDAVEQLEKMYGVKFFRTSTTRLVDDSVKNAKHIFTLNQKSGHDAWTEAYKSRDLYRWLLSKQLPGSKDP
jgi:predicted peptidase